VPPALAQLGVSGTVILSVTVAADGHVIAVHVVTSSGIPLIDQTAIDHVKQATFPPFNNQMPTTPQTYTLPVQISASDDSGN
jgi:protein TonB